MEFEDFVALLFTKMGYEASVTKSSGDQGLDILVKKHDNVIGIQAKCYSGKVRNSAIQEIAAALNYYNCNKSMVVTNSYFTDQLLNLQKRTTLYYGIEIS